MKKHFKLFGAAATAAMVFAGCSNDELVDFYPGEEISFRTRMETRAATIEKTDDLPSFKVWGLGNGHTDFFLKDGVAKQDESGKNHYTLKTKDGLAVYWPNGVSSVEFWAYGPSGDTTEDNTYNIDVKESFGTDKQSLEYTIAASTNKGGESHKDLVVAHAIKEADESTGGNIALNFYHALSNILINIKSGDPSKFMSLKGAWLVNTKNSGTLTFSEAVEPHHMVWTLTDTKATFGALYDGTANSKLSEINTTSSSIIGGLSKNDLMLLPQKANKVTFKEGQVENEGTYILLLCRIESEHSEAHEGGEATTHRHQLFPDPENNATTPDENAYGYSCIPVDIDWEPGKRYIYNLEFCGKTSGGGLYPPTVPDGLPEGVDPGKHKPGDKVLDNPITFTVTIEEWKDASGNGIDTPMS